MNNKETNRGGVGVIGLLGIAFVERYTSFGGLFNFAGKGTDTEIRDRYRLESDYHIPADEWEKVSGNGYIIVNGKKRYAELHWYEADGEVHEIKIKRYKDES